MEPLETVKKPLVIMKFGGTSVGDATRIRKVVEIVRDAARESEVVVVVSAMSGCVRNSSKRRGNESFRTSDQSGQRSQFNLRV